MKRQDRLIVDCARRMVKKLEKAPYFTLNNDLHKSVSIEVARMKAHCTPQESDSE